MTKLIALFALLSTVACSVYSPPLHSEEKPEACGWTEDDGCDGTFGVSTHLEDGTACMTYESACVRKGATPEGDECVRVETVCNE